MILQYPPAVGTILRVDLNNGFAPPEMVKRRPCIVITPDTPDRRHLCAIVPLSTTAPKRMQPYHHRLVLADPLPFPYDAPVMWAKCDMVMSVGYQRLSLLFIKKNDAGKREYDTRILPEETMAEIRNCLRHALGL